MIRTIGKNHFEVKVYAGRDPFTGKERRVSRTIRGSKREARTLERELQDARHATPSATVGELLDRWVERSGMERSSKYQTEFVIRTRLKPVLGAVKVARLTTRMVEDAYQTLARTGGKDGGQLSPGSVQRAHTVLRAALEVAVEWDWIPVNVARRARTPSVAKGWPDVPEPAEVRKLIEAADDTLGLAVRLLAMTGMRRGEVCALRWADISDGSVRKARAIGIAQGGPYEKGTKTGLRHRISLDTGTQDVLAAYQSKREAIAADFGVELGGFVLSPEVDGSTPMNPSVLSHRFARLRDRLGLDVQLKNLRHFHATQLLEAGESPMTVAARLGHSSPTTTLTHYAGWSPAADRSAAERIGRLL